MMLNEVMKPLDCAEFIEAMHKEINDHIRRKHWKVVPKTMVPKDQIPILMVWSMKCKRNPISKKKSGKRGSVLADTISNLELTTGLLTLLWFLGAQSD